MRAILDSNIAIAAMNQVPAVVERLATMRGGDVGIPIVAIAELTYGARRSRRVEENLSHAPGRTLRRGARGAPDTRKGEERLRSPDRVQRARGGRGAGDRRSILARRSHPGTPVGALARRAALTEATASG